MNRPSIVRALFLAMIGTGLGMGLVFPLVVTPFAEYRPGLRLAFSGLSVVAGLVVGGLNFMLVRRFLLRTVDQVSLQLEVLARGEGVAAAHLTLDSDDALGRLVQQFNALIDRLQGTLHRVIETVEAFVAHADETGQTARHLVASVDRKGQVVSGTAVLFTGLREELETIEDVLGRLKASSEESRTSVGAQARQIGEVSAQITGLQKHSEAGSAAMERAAAALQRTSSSTEDLTRMLEGAAASMAQIDATVRAIDEKLAGSTVLAERVETDALAGDHAVASTRMAMERVRDSVAEAAASIAELSRRVGEISVVTGVIDEVTEQTGLLALNAAILAAQAGEHGRGFAVVASQIKTLADRTAGSTRQIDGIVGAFRGQAEASLASMGRSRGEVEEGVELSNRAAAALGSIRESATESLRQVQAIGRSTKEIAAATHAVSQTAESIAVRAKEIAAATTEQGREIIALRGTVDEWRRVTATIVSATTEQERYAQRIQNQAEAVAGLVQKSAVAVSKGRDQTDMLVATVGTLQDLDAREAEGFGRVEAGAGRLAEKAQLLRREIERLKPQDGSGAATAAGAANRS